jgi:menaquinone-dependent protoporphyrinogen oxidase
MRVLVAYATKNGSTEGIARAIGEELAAAGLDPDVLPVRAVRRIDPYGAVVLGSAVYIGRWRPEALRFARRNAEAMRQRAVWLFGSGPLGGPATAAGTPPVTGRADLERLVGARAYTTFGGRLTEETPGLIARSIVKQGRGGDFRDFDAIRAWAHDVAGALGAHGNGSPHAAEAAAAA